jgi:hypothetical protein
MIIEQIQKLFAYGNKNIQKLTAYVNNDVQLIHYFQVECKFTHNIRWYRATNNFDIFRIIGNRNEETNIYLIKENPINE